MLNKLSGIPLLSASVNVGIVDGTEAQPHSRPYMVSIRGNGLHVCGGFLISDEYVMTAAHCNEKFIYLNRNEILTVVAGVHDFSSRSENPVKIQVKSYNKHPDYNTDKNKPSKADLMILKLEGKVQLQNKMIETIPIPTKPNQINANTRCSVAGWGYLTNKGPVSKTLMEADVYIKNNTYCANQWGIEYIASQMICVDGKGGSCDGDSGGPLVCGNTAVGVTAFSSKTCNDPNLPNVYIDISKFDQWIKSIQNA
ncbi:Granzyme M [Triplophysa tibetana]|uniref:Granzyme M n=1 Tax=Triplophysa tibetana TaxID=1572043 RepID=A0A5A9PRE4_9TELE|nr:Granzyme M [Triplophysa tibetana]KAA0724172.1 Granzyme M [Triplophysa tibetana]